MDAPKGKPLKAFPAGPRARKLQGFGIGAGREGKVAGQSPTVPPFGFHPIPYVPSRGLRLEGAGEPESRLTLKGADSRTAQRDLRTQGVIRFRSRATCHPRPEPPLRSAPSRLVGLRPPG